MMPTWLESGVGMDKKIKNLGVEVEMSTERSIVIEQIYEKNKHLYRDLRDYGTVEQMESRLFVLKASMNTIPEELRNDSRYKMLFHEDQLLRGKYLIYKGSTILPKKAKSDKKVLILGDLLYQANRGRGGEEMPAKTRALKKNATILILNYIFIDKSLQDLAELV
jgi:hypothetical protein